jgi:hypothetical protein
VGRLRWLSGKRLAIANKSGAYVPFLRDCCQMAVVPLDGRSLWHRNVQSVNGFLGDEVVRCGKP